MDKDIEIKLVETAIRARDSAYAPYSRFQVGAALLDNDGVIITGCNIENAAYTPAICAERTAFAKAVSEGKRDFAAIAVAGWAEGNKPDFAYPCGVCRQVMMEFVKPDTFKVIVAKSTGDYRSHSLKDLLPYGFGPDNLS
ncbi:MAG: cytidine deaminase [Defluviitaleaceae bacterium]|nr:cytidine deaminase [Defluviitaleaceae bacterium]MCL2835711.1 cytidine deaminase [Defluviitaleaceae bacterium]